MIVIFFFFFFTKLSSGESMVFPCSVFIPRKWERKREECDTALVGES